MKNIFIIFLFYSCASHNLKLKVTPSHFYQTNQRFIDERIKFIEKFCKPKKNIELALKFDYVPTEALNINPNQLGMTSFFPDLTLIETNIYKFAYMSEQEKDIYMLHELGHAVGLEHEYISDSVMHPNNNPQADKTEFSEKVKEYCKTITDVPHEPRYL